MGCINSKAKPVGDARILSEESGPISTVDSRTISRRRLSRKGSVNKHASRANSSKIGDSCGSKDRFERWDRTDTRITLIDKNRYSSDRFYDDQIGKIVDKSEESLLSHPSIGRIPKATEGGQMAAGWPSWLVGVAGEALAGWVPRRAGSFEKLDKIGQGTYSSVYKARDLVHNKIVALKKVRFDINDFESLRFMAREIIILRRLDHPNIIKLEGLITSPISCSIYLVFEYMEHDLVGLGSLPTIKFSEPQVKCYMHQLLSGLDHCHSRGVLHRDIKGSNLLIDSKGILKLADFGLASFYDPHERIAMTSRVVTLWYRPPELLLGASHYGVGVDLWSAGCILGELYAGKPILPGKTEVEQLHKVFKLCGSPPEDYWRKLKLRHSTAFKPATRYRRCLAEAYKDFPAPVTALMDTLLQIDPAQRGTAASALKSEFFMTKPFACDPSALPKYPPSKEIDAKMREEETRRERALHWRGEKVEPERRVSRDVQGIPALRTNAALTTTMQKQWLNSRSRNDIYKSRWEETASGSLVDPTKSKRDAGTEFPGHQHVLFPHSGPLTRGTLDWSSSGRAPDLQCSLASHLGTTRIPSYGARQGQHAPSCAAASNHMVRNRGSFRRLVSGAREVRGSHYETTADYPQARSGRIDVKEPIQYGEPGDKIYLSGPLLVPSNNVDRILKEHDLKLQEYARKTRLERATPGGNHV